MECAWVAKVEDNETNRISKVFFRYLSFGSDESAKNAVQRLVPYAKVLDVSKNPYEWKDLSR